MSTHSLPLPQSISRKADIDVSFHSPQTAGVIIKIEREMFRILDQSGTVRSLKPSQISSKVSTRFAVATDMEGFDIKAGETMKEANPVRSQFLRERSFLERNYTLILDHSYTEQPFWRTTWSSSSRLPIPLRFPSLSRHCRKRRSIRRLRS